MDRVPFYMARLRKAEAAQDAPATKSKADDATEDLQIAAEDVLVALGQDYGSASAADESQRNAFKDKAKRLARALHAAFVICESMPHEE